MTTQTTEAATPETDDQPMINAINDNGYQVPCVDIEYARKLERERDEARKYLKWIHDVADSQRKWNFRTLAKEGLTKSEGAK